MRQSRKNEPQTVLEMLFRRVGQCTRRTLRLARLRSALHTSPPFRCIVSAAQPRRVGVLKTVLPAFCELLLPHPGLDAMSDRSVTQTLKQTLVPNAESARSLQLGA